MSRAIRQRPELQAPQVFLLGALWSAAAAPVTHVHRDGHCFGCTGRGLVVAYASDQAREVDRLVQDALKKLAAQGRVS